MPPARPNARKPITVVLAAFGWASIATAAEPDSAGPAITPASLTLRYATPAIDAPAKPDRFGTKGQQWWTIGGGVAHNFASDNDLNVRVAYSRFIGKDADQPVELFAELNLWSFFQKGDDALGINPAFGLRWHFFNGPRWSWFADAGIGLLFSTANVPDSGTSFNFTPRFGLGATWQMSPTAPDRLQVGLRWHHVSNARINGDVRNPARDSLMLYAGVMLPF